MDRQLSAASRLLALFCLCLLTATGCAQRAPLGPTVSRADRFTLAPGVIADISGTGLRVEFVAVVGDSRCPADVLCIQLGEAVLHLRVYDNGIISAYELRTGNPDRGFVVHRDLRIELVDLQPYPFSNRRIQQSDYRATLITR
jgi:hypothetical protein